MSGEEYEKLIAYWNTPVLPAMLRALTETLKQNTKFDKNKLEAIVIYLRMMLRLMPEDQAAKEIRSLGFMFGDDYKGVDDNKGGNGMPSLGKYLPRLQQAFVEYIRGMLEREFQFLAEEPERLEAIVSEVEEAMYEEDGPNMATVLDMAEELGMQEEQG